MNSEKAKSRPMGIRAVLIGGILPVVLFTVVEEKYGVYWGLVVGMVFGIGEISYELFRYRRVETMTWVGNAMILALGGVSLLTSDGIWFKLQPPILEGAMGIVLLVSVILKKPFLSLIAKRQGAFDKFPAPMAAAMEKAMSGMTFRIALFFFLHAVLATWAALFWSTRAWALLKGVGFTLSLIVYMLFEAILLRRGLAREVRAWQAARPQEMPSGPRK